MVKSEALVFYDEELLASCPIPVLDDCPLLAVCDCLFSIFAATLHIWRLYPPTTTQRTHCAVVPWTHITWSTVDFYL